MIDRYINIYMDRKKEIDTFVINLNLLIPHLVILILYEFILYFLVMFSLDLSVEEDKGDKWMEFLTHHFYYDY